MKKILSIILCMLFSIIAAYAQESAEQELLKIYKEKNQHLEAKIDSLQENVVNKLIKDTTELSKQLKKAKETAGKYIKNNEEVEKQRDKYKHERDSIQNLLNKLKREHPAKLEADRLRNDSITLADRLKNAGNSAKKDVAQKDSTINALRKELEQLEDFKVQFIASLANDVENKWLLCSFADIISREQQLVDDIKLYEKFKNDSRVKSAYDKLVKLNYDLRVYKSAYNLLHNGIYNITEVNKYIKLTQEIINKNDNRKSEIEEIHNLLTKYTNAVEDFKAIISTIYNASAKDQESIVRRLEKRLYLRVESIKQIPWLAEQYEKYVKEVAGEGTDNSVKDMTNPENTNTIAYKISKLKTE